MRFRLLGTAQRARLFNDAPRSKLPGDHSARPILFGMPSTLPARVIEPLGLAFRSGRALSFVLLELRTFSARVFGHITPRTLLAFVESSVAHLGMPVEILHRFGL